MTPMAGKKPKLYFDAPAAYFGNEKEVAEAIKAMLEEVGFEVELEHTGHARPTSNRSTSRATTETCCS